MNEVEIFEFLKGQVEAHGLEGLSINHSKIPGRYVAAWNSGSCRTGDTIAEAVGKFPDPKQQVETLNKEADKLEANAAELRDKAAKLVSTTNLEVELT